MSYSPWIVIISCTALLISCASFYFNHLRRVRDLRAVVVDAGWVPDSHEVFVDIVYLNRGTEPEAVVGVALRFYYSDRDKGELLDLADGTLHSVKADPLIIDPKSKCIKHYRCALNAEKLKSAQGRCHTRPPFVSLQSKIRFKVMDPDGFLYEVNIAKDSCRIPGCPVGFAFPLDEVFPLERRTMHELQLMEARERYRGFRSSCTRNFGWLRLRRELKKLPPIEYS